MQQILSFSVGGVAFAVIAWWFCRRIRDSDDPKDLTIKWIITAGCVVLWIWLGIQAQGAGYGGAFVIPGVAAATGIMLAVLWTPRISSWLISPITKWYDGGDEEPEMKPLYSIAQAYRNRGNYEQAIAEIYRQLRNFPNDYQGYMMLAEVFADDLHDMEEAGKTVEHLLTIPELASKNAAYALTRLADWEVKYRSDLETARALFHRIIDLLPNTVEAQLAAQRIAHMASPEDLANMQDPRVIHLEHHEERIGLQGRVVEAPKELTPAAMAQRYVDHLREHPLDNETREKLAQLYANEYQRLDLAQGELEQLIAAPNQIPKHVVHWLNLLADLQMKLTGDAAAARKTLERIGELYPESAAANNARVRISQLKLELNQHAAQRTVKLGSYEQNIGLRKMNSSGARD
jgi:tetratricopeptide (TPR) repeat protein